jgi:serine/threonine-protein kinase
MSTVFLVEDPQLQRRVALKVMDVPDSSPDLTDRLHREARILAQLEHPGIVPVHDVGRLSDGRVFYTMKFVEGQRLDDHIAQIASIGERLRLFERICETVAFAHARGVLHRDLKPANVMVGPFGEVLVLDWGVAKLFARDVISRHPSQVFENAASDIGNEPAAISTGGTQQGSVIGTPGYMAPEQERGEIDKLDQRADVYSLGMILRLLVSVNQQQVPKALKAICDKACSHLAGDRYVSARDLAADVLAYVDGFAVLAYPEPWWAKVRRWIYRNRAWVGLVMAYLILRLLLLFLYRR